jgi:hypothetical protein
VFLAVFPLDAHVIKKLDRSKDKVPSMQNPNEGENWKLKYRSVYEGLD